MEVYSKCDKIVLKKVWQDHIARLFGRIPGVSSEHLNYLTIWFRSAVAHWLQMDMLHGNECVPTLIGLQGCGKTVSEVQKMIDQAKELEPKMTY